MDDDLELETVQQQITYVGAAAERQAWLQEKALAQKAVETPTPPVTPRTSPRSAFAEKFASLSEWSGDSRGCTSGSSFMRSTTQQLCLSVHVLHKWLWRFASLLLKDPPGSKLCEQCNTALAQS